MAKNLRAKLPDGDTLTVFDVNTASVDRFVKEAEPANVQVGKNPREVAEKAVCVHEPVVSIAYRAKLFHQCSTLGIRALFEISLVIKA